MRGSDELERSGNLYLKTTQLIGGLKQLGMELNVPVLCLSQLNRSLESRDDPRPRMSDLRDSGAIEQDADGIWFLFREHYYLSRAIPKRRDKEKGEDFEARYAAWEQALAASIGRAEVDIAKQRQGPIGPVRMRFRDELTWFFDDAEGDGGPAVPGLAA
jgi:replicative DNA helicase